ncbi:unnamed protein product [Arabidopsis arenosa]|uniref:Non-specific serine/threonine protein kinase n=1 Tax=Arabidopsis arenosa TaxID=38785 RepID=A0A8S1ZUD6_ARAAE|nr:unnamed protein product [Arabidopsis arenosa]
MMRSVQNYHHSYIFIILILFLAFSVFANTFSATESLTISSNKTIISPNQIFELGFFNPASSSRWYLGIWFKIIPIRTYVWVANRDNPLSSSNGTLKISGNNLVIFDQSDGPVWSTNITGGDVRSPVVAELLDNGNFVLRDSKNNDTSGFLWQSFDFPTDTLLSEMKLGWDNKTGYSKLLRSWKTTDDPSSGDFSIKLRTSGFPEFYVCNRESITYRSGPWIGNRFSSVPGTKALDYIVNNFTMSNQEVAYTYRVNKTNIYSILSLSSTGLLQRLTWMEAAQSWKQLWYSPKDLCDNYKECGNYGYCDANSSPVCNCIKGFEPMNDQVALRDDSVGCVRKTNLSCDGRDGFVRLKKMRLPDTTTTIVDKGIGLKECEERCLKDCNCTAFANTDIRNGGSGCVIWTGELLDIRNYAQGGQDLYVRIAAADLVDQVRSQDSLMNEVVISSRIYKSKENKTEYLELPMMELKALAMATNNFSNDNKLGQGGFGIVYKGRLLDGKDIAIISGKRNKGFYNSNHDLNLLSFVWRHWTEGKGLEIVDRINIDSSSSTFRTQILRCIQIGLLCVQERAEDRPEMSSVMVMLGSETTAITQPKRPGFCIGKRPLEADSSSSTQCDDECSVNQITLSVIDAR